MVVAMEVAMDSIAGISNHQSDTALTNQAITQDSHSLSYELNQSQSISLSNAQCNTIFVRS